jgi:selenocysteine lyase/cysteine desulfurase
LKLVGESFPWTANSSFYCLVENHNSVLGIREFAAKHNATFIPVTLEQIFRIPEQNSTVQNVGDTKNHHLVAFPAENNFTGAKIPLDLIHTIHSYCSPLK